MSLVKRISIPLGLGFIVSAPKPAVVPLGSNASYSCTAIGDVFWRINEMEISVQSQVDNLAQSNIFAPLLTANHSVVIITATLVNNVSTIAVECLVAEEGQLRVLNRTGTVGLLVYGELISM